MGIRLGCVFAGAIFRQESLERSPNIFFLLDLHGLEIRLLNLRKESDHAAAVIAGPQGLYLAVTEQIGGTSQFLGGLEGRIVVRLEVVAVGTMKDVDIPERRMITLLDDLQRLDVSR